MRAKIREYCGRSRLHRYGAGEKMSTASRIRWRKQARGNAAHPTLFMAVCTGLALFTVAPLTAAVPVDLSSFRPSTAFAVKLDGSDLTIDWTGEKNLSLRLVLNLESADQLIKELSHGA